MDVDRRKEKKKPIRLFQFFNFTNKLAATVLEDLFLLSSFVRMQIKSSHAEHTFIVAWSQRVWTQGVYCYFISVKSENHVNILAVNTKKGSDDLFLAYNLQEEININTGFFFHLYLSETAFSLNGKQ